MLQGEHSATLSTFIKLPFIFKPFALSIFEWPLKAGFTIVKDCVFYYSKSKHERRRAKQNEEFDEDSEDETAQQEVKRRFS